MIFLKLQGQLGNLMFQLAFYMRLKEKYPRKKILLVYNNYRYLSQIIFKIKRIIKLNNKETNHKRILKNSFKSSKVFEKIEFDKGKNFKKSSTLKMIEDSNIQDVFNFIDSNPDSNILLDGFWQSEVFFAPIKQEIISKFTFKKFKNEKNFLTQKLIITNNTVSIHIRRGDYLNPKIKSYFHTCDLDYFNNAISYFKNIIKDPLFVIFSDDISWAKKNIVLKRCLYVDWNSCHPHDDMHLMSLCKNNIISNSSFSWWGAYLNQNPEKKVIAPKKWFNSDLAEKYQRIPTDWITIDN